MSTISDAIQNTLKEELAPGIQDALWELDPVYPNIVRSSQQVVRNEGIGRGHKIIKIYGVGVAGGAKFGAAGGGNVLSGPNNFTAYDTPLTFQSLSETTAPTQFILTTNLISHTGNFFLP
ncbi:MAG: hypothetical protein AAB262_07130, partial [Elusimicrobiota bacterium]